jgi:hypothetical protein
MVGETLASPRLRPPIADNQQVDDHPMRNPIRDGCGVRPVRGTECLSLSRLAPLH